MTHSSYQNAFLLRRQLEKVSGYLKWVGGAPLLSCAAVLFLSGCFPGIHVTMITIGTECFLWAPHFALKCGQNLTHMELILFFGLSLCSWNSHLVLTSPPSPLLENFFYYFQCMVVMIQALIASIFNISDASWCMHLVSIILAHLTSQGLLLLPRGRTLDFLFSCSASSAILLGSLTVKVFVKAGAEALGELEAEKQKAVEEKHSFLSYIMHEVRNPLSAASLLLHEQEQLLRELLQKTREKSVKQKQKEKDGKQQDNEDEQLVRELSKILKTTRSQMEQVEAVCNDVLHLEKLAAGRFQFSFSSGCIRSTFSGLVEETRRISEASGISFSSEVLLDPAVASASGATDCDGTGRGEGGDGTATGRHGESDAVIPVWADFSRLQQVVRNFTSNARKFTKKGGWIAMKLSVTLSNTGRGGGSGARKGFLNQQREKKNRPDDSGRAQWVRVRVEVSDSGVGFEPSAASALFKAYSQIREGQSQNAGGTGLGLCISRVFVEAHSGGHIGAESEGAGRGALFFFEFQSPLVPTLPRLLEERRARQDEDPMTVRGLKDDTERVTEDKNISLSLPVPSRSKEEAEEEKETAQGGSDTGPETTGAASTLSRGGSSLFSPRSCAPTPPTPVGQGSGCERRRSSIGLTRVDLCEYTADVLLVEDNALSQMATQLLLRRFGLSVEIAEDGQAAVDRFKEKGEWFKLLLVDRNMPRMEGPECIREIKEYCRSVINSQENVKEPVNTSETPTMSGNPLSRRTACPIFIGLTGQTEGLDDFVAAGASSVLLKPATADRLRKACEEAKVKAL
uniref:histidine kinase n=1 Tax=Chromera velia CCMP2878 TaxID=1169474 RepID=A0A0G4HNT6_9ALVE|eukprot:Cvel_29565.t1-p1 / transcript=Cvel_29565.t1 / gene=Cvel_29565 / organism=Chromera_velia_CCMP2878 / gene_product=Ethylene receptor, putative / transcript_product=Ethylene receptor, putative / location=Cvel_scaffold4063:4366-9021(+) / protein_length=796 / sequence_SO=supercontig / SO=protein_coding / is_pseudo=false